MTNILFLNLSLFFAGLILLTALLRYNNTEYEERLMNLVAATVEPGLAFFFVFYGFYLWYVINRGLITEKDARLYKSFAYVVAFFAVISTLWDSQSFNSYSGWSSSAHYVAAPIAASSMFVVPLLLVSQ
jgi:hypothetical protein